MLVILLNQLPSIFQGLKIGDRLLRVNDTDFRSIEHQVAVRVIQSATRLVIYVTSTHITNLPGAVTTH